VNLASERSFVRNIEHKPRPRHKIYNISLGFTEAGEVFWARYSPLRDEWGVRVGIVG